jgi:hypothetical protein
MPLDTDQDPHLRPPPYRSIVSDDLICVALFHR